MKRYLQISATCAVSLFLIGLLLQAMTGDVGHLSLENLLSAFGLDFASMLAIVPFAIFLPTSPERALARG